jgi:phosphoacetylglucosamine mutase
MGGAIARVGVFACLRSRWCKSKFIGIMITASHNPEPDNGAKLADEDGGMLEEAWEPYIETFANCQDTAEAIALVKDLIQRESINCNIPAHVVIGRDTRPSSEALWAAACSGVRAMGGMVHDIGTVTTPQLHLVVRLLNEKLEESPEILPSASEELDRYYSILADGYMSLRGTAAHPSEDRVVIDCSFGIGSVSMSHLTRYFNDNHPDAIQFDLRNPAGSGRVNEGCGAELVQKEQTPPCGVTAEGDEGKCVCSFDGDADRIVFHRFKGDGKWELADGDKIACLLAVVLKTELVRSGLTEAVSFGVVQTAYANGSSTDYLRSHRIPVVFAKTGVKFLHRKAVECFDAAIYFEANGHGTILFSKKFCETVKKWDTHAEEASQVTSEQLEARKRVKV